MTIDLPRIDLGGWRRRLPDIEVPDIDRDRFSMPRLDLPKIELKDLDLRRPDLSGAKDALSDGVEALGRRIDELGHEVRNVRVVRGPEPRVGPAAGIALLGGLGIGMALMYFLDPRAGQRRRTRIIDRLMSLVGRGAHDAGDDWTSLDDTPVWADEPVSDAGPSTGTARGADSMSVSSELSGSRL
ncbi:MAG: hypothetical protein H0V36_00655 [Chloroflexi bacterium]|nr:hypothetical protein [Chloroflexota bacterium]